MIVPIFPKVAVSEIMDKYPWTITLTFLNFLLFYLLFASQGSAPSKNEFTREFIESAGRYYLEWKNDSQFGRQPVELQSFGAQAVRNATFLNAVESWNSTVDPIGFHKWKNEFKAIMSEEKRKATHIFGLSQSKNSLWTWVTYQFSHQNLIHMISNVSFLIFFAACVESLVGGFLMGVVYLLGGIMGGFFFMCADQSGYIPMVGASASVTGLMGFLVTATPRKSIPYFNFYLWFVEWMRIHFSRQPIQVKQGHLGEHLLSKSIVYLSPFWIIPLFLVEDLNQIISDPPGWGGGVAHSAHLGGAFVGLLLGLAFRWGALKSELFDWSKPSS